MNKLYKLTKACLFGILLITAFFNVQGQVEVKNPTSPFWNVKGNSGTNSGTNFIGTIDNVSWRVRTDNTERMVVDSLGNVGIGTANPSARLHVYKTDGDAILRVETPSSSYEARIEFWKWTASYNASVGFYPGTADLRLRTGQTSDVLFEPNSTEVMRVRSNGRVGIGTATPSTTFVVNGSATIGNTANTASGTNSMAVGSTNTVSGTNSFVSGNNNTVTATHALVAGNSNNAAGNYSVALNNTTSTTAAATTSIVGGFQSQVQSNLGLAIGWADTTSGVTSQAFGRGNYARSFAEFVVGSFNTDYTPVSTGSFNAADRAFTVGNGTATTSRSNALVVLKNGNVGIGINAPLDILHIVGHLRMVDGNQANGYVMVSDANGTGTWTDPSALGGGSAWNLTGNSGTNSTTNFIGTTDANDLVLKTNGSEAMRILSGGHVSINYATPSPGNLFSVYSTNSDNAVNIFANGTGKAMYISMPSTNNANAIEISKSGGSGRGIDLTMASGTTGVGILISSQTTSRTVNIQQTNASSASPVIFVSNSGTGNTIYALANTPSNAIGYFKQQSTGTDPIVNQSAASVFGTSTSIRSGIFEVTAASSNSTALLATAKSSGSVDEVGVYGLSMATDTFGYGVIGEGNHYGVYAVGNLGATGVKSFQIDDPMDPYNKYLKHYSVESPEVINMYRGTVVLDGNGEGTVTMPDYFDSVNINCTYSLTAIGKQTNVYIKQEISNGKFIVAGGASGQKICWFVYANRNDRYVKAHPGNIQVEVRKNADERGKLISPELYGMPPQYGVFYNNKVTPSAAKQEELIPEKQ